VTTPSLDTSKDFSGSAEELARLGTELSRATGLSEEELSVRLVRDYAQRDILSRPERQGKEAVYGWRHLVELLAARALLADGWPLAKISEHFAITPLEGLLALIPGQARGGSAVETARRIREQTQGRRRDPDAFALSAQSAPPMMARQAALPELLASTQLFATRTSRRAELDAAMQQLGRGGARPDYAALTRIALDEDIQLLAATERLRSLTLEEADAIGRAVTAAIVDWLTAKGGKQP
jgi:hypothetical protein